MYDILELNDKLLSDLRQIAKALNIKRPEAYRKQKLIDKIIDQQAMSPIQLEQDEKEGESEKPQQQPERREKRPRTRTRTRIRSNVEKVGDSNGGIQKFMRREEGKREENKVNFIVREEKELVERGENKREEQDVVLDNENKISYSQPVDESIVEHQYPSEKRDCDRSERDRRQSF